MLDPRSPVPLYRQLADLLAGEIRAGRWAEGAQLPSEHELATQHGLGRPTVRQATEQLVRAGLAERRRGAGTFVKSAREAVDLFTLSGTLSAFEGAGIELHLRLAKAPCALTKAPKSAGPLAGHPVEHLVRLGSVDKRPVLLEELWLDSRVFPELHLLSLAHRSLSSLVAAHYRLVPNGGEQRLAVATPPRGVARHLQLEAGESPLLVCRRLDFPQAPAALFANMWCVTSRVSLVQPLQPPTPWSPS